jgi:serine/threonine-protein kinase
MQAPVPVQEVAAPKKGRDFRLIAVIGIAVVFAGLAAWGWLQPAPVPDALVPTRITLTDFEISRQNGWRLAISRDGRAIVAGHAESGASALYLRPADATEWRELGNTQGATNPGFSPDGQWVYFDQGGSSGIYKVPISGGPALPIVTNGGNGHWATNDTIVYSAGGQIYRVAGAGGESELLFASDSIAANRPHLLPGSYGVIFGTGTGGGTALSSRVLLLEIETGEIREIVPSGNQPWYVSTGHIIYGHGDQALMAVSFDVETLEVTGTPVTLLPNLNVYGGGASQFAVSETGTLIYDAGSDSGGGGNASTLVQVDMEGVEQPLPLSPGALDVPRYSPDGGKIAYEDGAEIRIYDVVTGASPQFTASGGAYPVWSESGNDLYYTSSAPPDGSGGWSRPSDFSEEGEQVYALSSFSLISDVSSGDSILLVRATQGETSRDLLLFREGPGSLTPENYLTAEWNEGNPEISPDGRWVAYQSDESGEPRIYVHSFPSISGQRSVSPGLGTDPVWSPDGQKIYYRSGSQFLSVDVTTDPVFEVSAPGLLFENVGYTRIQSQGWVRNWDLHPDGDRFIMVRSEGGAGGGGATLNAVYVVVNWFEELRARMGN